MPRGITYGQLPDLFGKPGPRPFLYCPGCSSEYSAASGDYFWADDSEVITCASGHRRRNVLLVVRTSYLREITPLAAGGGKGA